jgi:2-polyprenyl-3-methyl-5-hydroxy-6-metoxy-1,4-benzoquinol methylase
MRSWKVIGIRADFFDCGPATFYNCAVSKTTEKDMAATVSRVCPVCGRDDAPGYLDKGALRLVRCRPCGMVYVNPVPTEFVSGQYYDQAGADYYLSPAKLESDYAAVRFERELRLFRRHCPGGAVLDVGCSSGAFLFQLNQRFAGSYQVVGTDVSGAPLDYAESRGVPVVRGDFLRHDFGATRFDAVTFWAVLEHLAEPRSFLEKAWSVLKPNGLCFVLVPNLQSLAVRLLGARYRYIYPQHLNYFSRATLTKLAGDRFGVVEVRSTHFNPVVVWQDWRRKGAEISNRERADLLQRTTAYKRKAWLKPVKALYGLTEKALGALNLADNLAVVFRKRKLP